MVGVVSACQPASVSTKPASGASGAASGAARGGAVVAHLGQPIDLTGAGSGEKARVVAVKVVDPARATDEFSTPDAGKRYVGVQFRITDTGAAAYSDSPSNGATAIDASGQQYSAEMADPKTSAGEAFPAATSIAPGDSALGVVVFQIPTGAKVVKVQFGMDSGMSGHTAQWNVS